MRYKWTTIDFRKKPRRRCRHVLSYDSKRECVVMFGGAHSIRSFSDTWIYNDGAWQRKLHLVAPKSRARAAMVFQKSIGKCLLFGGQHYSIVKGFPCLNDTWTYDEDGWQIASQAVYNRPLPRCGHSLAYCEDSGNVVLFGGAATGEKDLSFADTWIFDGIRWHHIRTPGPFARRYSQFAYDHNLKGCVLYGGCGDDFGEEPFTDTWLWKDNNWQILDVAPGPVRDDQQLVWHPSLQSLVLMDSRYDEPARVLTSDGWKMLEREGSSPELQCTGGVFLPSENGIFAFGGEIDDVKGVDDTHVIVFSNSES